MSYRSPTRADHVQQQAMYANMCPDTPEPEPQPKVEPRPMHACASDIFVRDDGRVSCCHCGYYAPNLYAHNQLSRAYQAAKSIKQWLENSGFKPLPEDLQGAGFMSCHESVAAILCEKGWL